MIAWGEPAIATSISTILHGRLVYRGKDAVALSAGATLEETANLLWAADAPVSLASPNTPLGQEGGRAAV